MGVFGSFESLATVSFPSFMVQRWRDDGAFCVDVPSKCDGGQPSIKGAFYEFQLGGGRRGTTSHCIAVTGPIVANRAALERARRGAQGILWNPRVPARFSPLSRKNREKIDDPRVISIQIHVSGSFWVNQPYSYIPATEKKTRYICTNGFWKELLKCPYGSKISNGFRMGILVIPFGQMYRVFFSVVASGGKFPCNDASSRLYFVPSKVRVTCCPFRKFQEIANSGNLTVL